MDRFNEKYTSEQNSGCWLWTGARYRNCYGAFRHNGRTVLAHRFAWSIKNGTIPSGMCVCHKCDVPNCVNPKHLFLGTIADNQADMYEKGRGHKAKGEGNARSKLSEADVIAIRADNRKLKEISADYDINQSAVSKIKNRQAWAHVA